MPAENTQIFAKHMSILNGIQRCMEVLIFLKKLMRVGKNYFLPAQISLKIYAMYILENIMV